MMKKLLVLTLVLGLAVAANAALDLAISVDGNTDLEVITLQPSDTVIIDIALLDGSTMTGYTASLNLDSQLGILDAAEVTFPTVLDFASAVSGTPTPQSVTFTGSQFFNPDVEGPAVLVDNVVFHCEGEGTVILDLVAAGEIRNKAGDTIQAGTILDRLVIEQVPEPMTMGLLGLGGLLLRRRK